MTRPRQILPGRTYLITRRCAQRQFLLPPDAETEAVFSYCLAEASERFGVETIAWLVMSNHYHAVVHDPRGNLPEFLAHLHKMIAKVLNDRWARTENLWSSRPCSVVRLVEQRDVVEAVVYVLCNPSRQDLVDRVEAWTGASSFRLLGGRTVDVPRPARFFRKNGRMPRKATLRAATPPGWTRGDAAWRTLVSSSVRVRERARRQARRKHGPRQQVGMSRGSIDTRGSRFERRGALMPTFMCADLARRRAVIDELRAFRALHHACVQRFLSGDRAVTFPPGTYKLRQFCAAHGPPPRPLATAS